MLALASGKWDDNKTIFFETKTTMNLINTTSLQNITLKETKSI